MGFILKVGFLSKVFSKFSLFIESSMDIVI
jgi:hypothetical protein